MWLDLGPDDISIILHILGNSRSAVNCQATERHPRVEDVRHVLNFGRGALLLFRDWLEPRKVREMTIVGSRRMMSMMICRRTRKSKVYDVRVDGLPTRHVCGISYPYHYGTVYIPHLIRGATEGGLPAFI